MSDTRFAPSSDGVPLQDVAVHIHPRDDVAIAKANLPPGLRLLLSPGSPAALTVRQAIPGGHKVALRRIAVGQVVHRYGQVIGVASQSIEPGEHVHVHNLTMHGLEQTYQFGIDERAATPIPVPADEQRTFLGYPRPDGRVGTRNYIAVLSTVNCSGHVCREIARHFTPERLAAFPNVDGVVPFIHHTGCTNRPTSRDYVYLQRILAGIAGHPNVGAYLLVGLGCESNQISALVESHNLHGSHALPGCPPPTLVIQELGGIRKAVQAGIEAVEGLLPAVDAARRMPQPISALTVALQCGGSDGWSGVTANPVVGLVSDEVVRQGGAVVLAETPEICGAEHLLARRAISPEVGRKLIAQTAWWAEHARRLGIELDDNRSVGNEAGGLTTIYEKSLGAVSKAGCTPLVAVCEYAEPITARGVLFMNTPGYDPVSVTGQVAGGCNLVLFTTGRGSVLGFKPAPCIKISTTTTLYECMEDDIDLNAGQVLEGASLDRVADELLDLTIAVASGQPSKSEVQGVGEVEFSPWNLGGTL